MANPVQTTQTVARRNSVASLSSQSSWLRLVPEHRPYHEGGPLWNFFANDEPLERMMGQPIAPLSDSVYGPPQPFHGRQMHRPSSTVMARHHTQKKDDSTVGETSDMSTADTDESLQAAPALCSNASSSTASSIYTTYLPTMYELRSGDNGELLTNQISPIHPILPLNRQSDRENTFPCIFWFDNCPQRFSLDEWKEWQRHCSSHLNAIDPPSSNTCSICGAKFDGKDKLENWEKYLFHVFHVHHKQDSYRIEIQPDQCFLSHLRDNGIISWMTSDRVPNLRPPSRQIRYSGNRRREQLENTPRSMDTARVIYPSHWDESDDLGARELGRNVARAEIQINGRRTRGERGGRFT